MKILIGITQVLIGLSIIIIAVMIAIFGSGDTIKTSLPAVVMLSIVLSALILSFSACITVLQYVDKIPRIEELERKQFQNDNAYQNAVNAMIAAAQYLQ